MGKMKINKSREGKHVVGKLEYDEYFPVKIDSSILRCWHFHEYLKKVEGLTYMDG